MKRLIGIIGGRAINTSAAAMETAEAVGAELAHRGLGLVCGGDDGAIEAACRGCKRAGGATLALLKGNHVGALNPHIDYAIPTSMDLARNHVILWAATGVIAFEGRYGTTSEIAVAMDIEKPLVIVGRCLIKDDALEAPWCARVPQQGAARAAQIVDVLLELVGAAEQRRVASARTDP
jgi:uncharacterized protein (TIGR00725 family)